LNSCRQKQLNESRICTFFKKTSIPYKFAFVSQLFIYGIQQLLGNKIVPACEKQGKGNEEEEGKSIKICKACLKLSAFNLLLSCTTKPIKIFHYNRIMIVITLK
jgi:hypothetical protein